MPTQNTPTKLDAYAELTTMYCTVC